MVKIRFKSIGVNKLLNNIKNREDELYKKIKKEYISSGIRIVIAAKRTIIRNDNIITGRLLNSIKYTIKEKRRYGKISKIELEVGSVVHYAKYVERRYPFLFPAFEAEKPVLMRNLKNIK